MTELEKRIYLCGIVPVVKINKVEDAPGLAKALCRGGLEIAEVTYRTECAHDAMIAMKKACPDMLIGAGTVLTKEQVDSAIDAGAEFIVSPGLNPKVVTYCKEKDIPIIPGTSCPSDMEVAIENGLDIVKFFPAEANGGLNAIKAMSAPYSQLKFMPTGGINEENMISYLNNPKILACGGTWMVKDDLISNHEYEKIEELTRKAVKKMLDLKLVHVGINCDSWQDARDTANAFLNFTGNQKDEKPASIFADDIECMVNAPYGKVGHIAYSTNNVERAKFCLEKKGVQFDLNSAQYDKNGKMVFIYTKTEIKGFAVHLIDVNKK